MSGAERVNRKPTGGGKTAQKGQMIMTLKAFLEEVIRPKAMVEIYDSREYQLYEGTAEETPDIYKGLEITEIWGLGISNDLYITIDEKEQGQ